MKLRLPWSETSSGGWRTGCTYFAMLTGAVFLLNLVFTVYALSRYEYDSFNGIGTLVKGSCKRIANLNTIAHVFINAFSTVLLSASNYTMQCLSAPTREEIDKAHKKKDWLDIGVLSMRNVLRVGRVKLLLWCLLAISSVPLHFLYNSAVVSTITNYEYQAWTVGAGIVHKYEKDFTALESRECIREYRRQFITNRKDVMVVVPGKEPAVLLSSNGLRSGWMCSSSGYAYISSDCNIDDIFRDPTTWMINGTHAQSCLTQEQLERCTLQFSLHLMVAVLVCNAIKFICILLTLLWGRYDKMEPLVTIGDAIVSFLSTTDRSTSMMSCMSEKRIQSGIWKYMAGESMNGESQSMWHARRVRWYRGASFRRWTICYSLSFIVIVVAIIFLFRGFSCLNYLKSFTDQKEHFIWSLPLGAPDSRLMIDIAPLLVSYDSPYSLVSYVITANLPHVLFSFIYLLYNSIFTCMLLGKEWDEFSSLHRPLRVTRPWNPNESDGDVAEPTRGRHSVIKTLFHEYPRRFYRWATRSRPTDRQGSTYFLQLPYKYNIPLIIASGSIHWMISQSIFVVRVATLSSSGRTAGAPPLLSIDSPLRVATSLGWSPLAIVTTILSSAVVLASALICGLQKYKGHIPLVGSCSAAISAACHPGPDIVVSGKVKWGVVRNSNGIEYCSFSDQGVPPPLVGRPYGCVVSQRDIAGYVAPQHETGM